MAAIGRIVLWFRALLQRTRVETDMEKEMRLHLEMEIEHNVRLGMAPDEARRAAVVAFGGVEAAKDAVRDERGTQWLEHTASDVRFALRGFRNHPVFAAGVVVVIALGVGPNAAIFSVINSLLISPLPYADGNRMVELAVTSSHGMFLVGASSDQVTRWRIAARAVEQITTFDSRSFEIGDRSRGPTEIVDGTLLTPGAAAFVRMRPMLGRDISANDTLPTAAPVALIGYSLWQRLFDGRADALGQSIVVNDQRTTIVGVMPEEFSLPFTTAGQVFPALRSDGKPHGVRAVARLRPGVSVDAANRELASIFSEPVVPSSIDVPKVERAIDQTDAGTRRVLLLMFGAVTLVLLIACANVANLMLARAWERQREFAVRMAMGAGRARLVRQMLTESVALAIAGAVVGSGVAWATMRLLAAAQPGPPGMFGAGRLQPLVLLWQLGLTLFVAIAFGLAPALFAARNRPSEALKAGARAASASRASRRARSVLVIAEVALSATLLVVCGLLLRSIVAAQRFDVGVDTRGLWGIRLDFDRRTMPDSVARAAAIVDMLQRVRAVPGITGATIAVSLPPNFTYGVGNVEIEGTEHSPNDTVGVFGVMITRPEYFAVAGTHLVKGRAFEASRAITDRSTSPEVVINESFAKRWWPNGDAIGAHLRIAGAPFWWHVVGIAHDVSVPMSRRDDAGIQVYEAAGLAQREMTLIVRTSVPMTSILTPMTAAIHDASARLRARPPMSAESIVSSARGAQRYFLTIVGTFTVLALALTAFGLHAVIAYSVGQRTREIGVRMALGARSADVLKLVFGQGVGLVGAGIVIGVLAGALGGRAARAMLYQVGAGDPLTTACVSVLLVLVAMVATYSPARRATRVDPVTALRAD